MKTFFNSLDTRSKIGFGLIAFSTLLFVIALLFPFFSGAMKGETVAAIAFATGVAAELVGLLGAALVGKEGIVRLKAYIKLRFGKKESPNSH